MAETFENIYVAWDAYAAAAQQKAGEPSLVDFASDFLQKESQATHLPLNREQSDLLVRLVDSFVDETGRRHRALQEDLDAEATATKALAAEIKKPLFTTAEIELAVKSGADEFAGLTESEIKDNLEGRKRFFKAFKGLLFAQQGNDFETVIAPYLPEADRAEAKRLFGKPEGPSPETSVGSELESNVQAHVDFVNTQAVLSRGLHARSLGGMLSEDGEQPERGAETGSQCLVEAFGGKLFSRAEDLVRKLTAVEFLLARMDLEKDEEAALPFLAVGAARAAYDWVTDRKASYQLSTLATALDDLEADKPAESATKGVAK